MIKVLDARMLQISMGIGHTMGFLAIAFVVGMGWWGFGEQTDAVVATVGDLSDLPEEFKRAYENTYRYYKDNVPGEFKEETLKQFVVDNAWIIGCGSWPQRIWE